MPAGRAVRRTLAALAAAVSGAAVIVAGHADPSLAATPASDAPVIVIDPGHSPTVDAIDRRTRLRVGDYENEPEMRDVYDVAQDVARRLRDAGYRVVLTKTSLRQRVTLAQRAAVANRAHAALALSIHDQAGSSGGIGFRTGNNVVYYQRVGDYRTNVDGRRIVFRDRAVAATSRRYAQLFDTARERVQGTHVTTRGDVGYDLGSRGLAPGNMWIVQLLSTVPWIYNEAGGNSAGRIGLSPADRATYARSLVAGVEACVPRPVPVVSSVLPTAAAPGSTITVRGSHFNAVRGVYFGAAPARVRRVSPWTLRVRVPMLVAGPVRLVVRTQYGTSAPRTFRVVNPPPTTPTPTPTPAPTPPSSTDQPSSDAPSTTDPAPSSS